MALEVMHIRVELARHQPAPGVGGLEQDEREGYSVDSIFLFCFNHLWKLDLILIQDDQSCRHFAYMLHSATRDQSVTLAPGRGGFSQIWLAQITRSRSSTRRDRITQSLFQRQTVLCCSPPDHLSSLILRKVINSLNKRLHQSTALAMSTQVTPSKNVSATQTCFPSCNPKAQSLTI